MKLKRLCILLQFLAINLLANIDLTKPIPEIRLKNGTTLRNLQAPRFSYNDTSIIARWDGGAGTIQYALLPDDLLAAISRVWNKDVTPQVAEFLALLDRPLPNNIIVTKLDDEGSSIVDLAFKVKTDEYSAADLAAYALGELMRASPRLAAKYTVHEMSHKSGLYEYKYTLFAIPTVDKEREKRIQESGDFLDLKFADQVAFLTRGNSPLPARPEIKETWAERSLFKTKLSGQIFVTTKGGSTIRISGESVRIFPKSFIEAFIEWFNLPNQPHNLCRTFADSHSGDAFLIGLVSKRMKVVDWNQLSPSRTETVTDAEGRFEITSPYSEYAIVVTGNRNIGKQEYSLGKQTEHYIWIITSDKVTDREKIILTETSLYDSWTTDEKR